MTPMAIFSFGLVMAGSPVEMTLRGKMGGNTWSSSQLARQA
jgi:hypothetical protein